MEIATRTFDTREQADAYADGICFAIRYSGDDSIRVIGIGPVDDKWAIEIATNCDDEDVEAIEQGEYFG